MHILIVYAHPNTDSFCHALKESVYEALIAQNHEVKIVDLYAEEFQPCMVPADFSQFDRKPLPDDVVREQARVEWSDGMVFIFPIWWWSFPAILKGWIDRVFSFGWAYENPSDPASGHLTPRRVLVLPTAGGDQQMFAKREYDKAFDIQTTIGTWDYCNFPDVKTHIFHDVSNDAPRVRLKGYLEQAASLATSRFAGD